MLRRSPRLTPASLAARRANALKSTGPRTEAGKARVALNPLRHGRYAVNLPDRLTRAGYVRSAAEWREIRARIAQVFEPTLGMSEPNKGGLPEYRHDTKPGAGPDHASPGPTFEKKMDRLANWVWCWHRDWQQQFGAELESPLESYANQTRLTPRVPRLAQIRIHNFWARLGLVFYVQHQRGWMLQQLTDLIVTWQTKGPEGAVRAAASLPRLELAFGMETGLRSRVYDLARPRFWERMRYCLDREGNYHPELRGRFRQRRRELRDGGLGWLLEPHPILTLLRQEAEKAGGTFGLSKGLG